MTQDSPERAFPKPDCNQMNAQAGMSLRDYFAATAMSGMLSDQHNGSFSSHMDFPEMATAAYRIADAMLAARDK